MQAFRIFTPSYCRGGKYLLFYFSLWELRKGICTSIFSSLKWYSYENNTYLLGMLQLLTVTCKLYFKRIPMPCLCLFHPNSKIQQRRWPCLWSWNKFLMAVVISVSSATAHIHMDVSVWEGIAPLQAVTCNIPVAVLQECAYLSSASTPVPWGAAQVCVGGSYWQTILTLAGPERFSVQRLKPCCSNKLFYVANRFLLLNTSSHPEYLRGFHLSSSCLFMYWL